LTGRVELSEFVNCEAIAEFHDFVKWIDCSNRSWQTIPLLQFDLTRQEKLSDSNLLR